jgi:hypothetical protein
MKRLLLAILVMVSLSACSYGELLEFVEGSGGGDLSSEENPTDVQAAGSTADAKADDEKAKEKITEALDPALGIDVKIGLATDAVQLRPADPRYLMHRAWFHQLAGDKEAAQADLAAARGLARQAYTGDEVERRTAEFYLDATYAVMGTYPDGSEIRDRMETAYCLTIFKYRSDFGSTLLGSAYLDFTAHMELCS